jgi:serpin B
MKNQYTLLGLLAAPTPVPMVKLARRIGVGLAAILAAGSLSAQDANSLQQLVQANNRFAIDIFQKISPKATENVFLSPYSISSALAMTWAGARGETADQMAKALHLSELPAGEATHDFTLLNKTLADAQSASGAQLSIANSLWPDQDPEQPFLPGYIASVEKDFAAGLFPVDYQHHAEESRLKINQWVADRTQDKIKNLVDPGDVTFLTRLALVNAIYFKGQWATAFDEQMTADEPFHLDGGSSKRVKLMIHTFQASEARYADVTSGPVPLQLLSLDYSSSATGETGGSGPRRGAPPIRRGPDNGGPGLSMLVVLPRNAGDLGALEKAITAEQLAAWVAAMKPAPVRVFLPKFKLDARYAKMPDQLKELGVTNAFLPPGEPNKGADFSGMNGVRGLYITKVIHQTFVAVDEKGTEAAAATAVLMGFTGAPRAEGPPSVFRADHPFLFFIRENATGSILFMGRLVNPSDTNADAYEEWVPAGATGQPKTLADPSASNATEGAGAK